MKAFSIIICLLSFTLIPKTSSHPAWGIVVSDNGDVYFADILHDFGTIWRYSKGKLNKWETGQHSHTLFLDDRGYIWGTNDEYLSETKENEHTLWRKKPGGELEMIIPPTRNPKEMSGAIFSIDNNGWIYFSYQKKIYKRKPAGPVEPFSEHSFQRITTLQIGEDGFLYVVDNRLNNGTIFQLDTYDGSICETYSNVKEENPVNPPFEEKNHQILYGMNIQKNGVMYMANSSDRRITRIYPNDYREHVYHSTAPWFPVGIAIKNEDMYILEAGYDRRNIGPRLVKVDKQGTIKELVKM